MNVRKKFEIPEGFRVAGIAAGIKYADRRDMMLLVSDRPATVAGTFTTNQVQAAPVRLDRQRVSSGRARAVIVNAGVANACTGQPGWDNAVATAAHAAHALNLPESEMLVCSTGSIGPQLPMDRIISGIGLAVAALGDAEEHAVAAAAAIMTTDTRPKSASVSVEIGGRHYTLSGITKGAGMIEPNMATMLAFLVTDAPVEAGALQAALTLAVGRSFNRISIDGDMSTNDTVLLFANGTGTPLSSEHADWAHFVAGLEALCLDLAHQIVLDGEGVTKFITLKVSGARSDEEADIAARSVANSFLVKTGWAGTYPVWGRIIDAVGYSRAKVDPDRVAIVYNDVPVARGGMHAGADPAAIANVIAQPSYTIFIDLGVGQGHAELYTCDCTEEYVRINMF